MPKTTPFNPSNLLLTCFMLVLVVFSTTMRFAGLGIEEVKDNVENRLISLKDSKKSSDTDKKTEKEPLTLKTSHSSDALLQGFIPTGLSQNVILTALVEFVFPSFSSQLLDSVTYYFSSSIFFKTLFSCFISPNAP